MENRTLPCPFPQPIKNVIKIENIDLFSFVEEGNGEKEVFGPLFDPLVDPLDGLMDLDGPLVQLQVDEINAEQNREANDVDDDDTNLHLEGSAIQGMCVWRF